MSSKLVQDFRRIDSQYTDEMLFDPLPQPYRFLNKILVQTIESAIDLAEDGGSAEAKNAFVCHNLRLTKVGKIPTILMDNYFLSTVLCPNEVSCYSIYAETDHLIIGSTQGTVSIFDTTNKQQLFTFTAASVSKFASGSALHITSFASDYDTNVVVFTCDDSLFFLFISSSFVLRGQSEVDISGFLADSLCVAKFLQPFVYVTDGTGRTMIFNCHTPADFAAAEASGTKNGSGKSLNMDPIFECDKCLISNTQVSSEHGVTLKIEDPSTKKKAMRRKSNVVGKGGRKVKSPGMITAESGQPVEMTRYSSTCIVHDDLILVYFEGFNILVMYSTQPTLSQVCDFSLPSKLTFITELIEGIVGIGFENGSFCLLNMKKMAITNHTFQRKGAISSIKASNNLLFTFTVSKNTTAYKFDGRRVGEEIFSLSDDDILDMKIASGSMLTYNGKPYDQGLCSALTSKVNWAERQLELVPNISFVQGRTGKYLGTVKTPSNLEVIDTLWSNTTCIMVYKDRKDYLVPATKIAPVPHGKRSAPKSRKDASKKNSKQGKASSGAISSRKGAADDQKDEQEPMIIQKREIIGVIKLDEIINKFEKSAASVEQAAEDRRVLLKVLSQKNIKN